MSSAEKDSQADEVAAAISEAHAESNTASVSEPLPSDADNDCGTPSVSHDTVANRNSIEELAAALQSDEVVIDASEIHFMAPVEGTPAAEALAANAQLKVTKFDKGLRKIRGIKHPKLKAFKRKKEGRKFSRNFKGKTIEGIHEQYTLTIGMMLGIRVSIGGRYNANAASPLLTLEDFSYVQKINFPPNGNTTPPFITPAHSLAHTFKFKTYAPKVFEKIREFFNVDSASYMASVCGDFNYIEFISNSKSGQFFFYSHDGRYMIKTQTKDENQFMKRILPHYYKYVSENPNTLLVKIFGMHRVKMYHLQRKIHFVIMGSVFDTTEVIHQIYDLKGSLVGRNATAKERANGGVLKDKDLIDDGVKFHLGAKKAAFIEQIRKDANFLASLNIMDYSLLVGIHDRDKRYIDRKVHASSSALVDPSPTRSQTPFRSNILESSNLEIDKEKTPAEVEAPVDSDPVDGPPSPTSRQRRRSSSRRNTFTEDAAPAEPNPNALRRRSSTKDKILEDSNVNLNRPNIGADGDANNSTSLNVRGSDDAEDEYLEESEEEEEHDDEGDSDIESVAASEEADRSATSIELGKIQLSDRMGNDPASNSSPQKAATKTTAASTPAPASEATSTPKRPLSVILEPRLFKQIEHMVSREANASAHGDGRSSQELQEVHRLSQVFRSPDVLLEMIQPDIESKQAVYGPGASAKHPWTTRVDHGVNSRTQDGYRGKQIYFIGIIDILQQYNTFKRMETIFKSITHDSKQISSVPAPEYAQRFVEFLDKNID